jgi:uncharacterized membrane protein
MADQAASRNQSIAFWTLFAIAAALAAGTIVALGPSVELPPAIAGAPVKTKSTLTLLIHPAAIALIWFAFQRGARANLSPGCFVLLGVGDRTAFSDADADVARATGTFARTLVNAALGWAALLLAMEVVVAGRLAGVEPFASLHGATIVRGFFAAAGVIEIYMGNVWPKSSPAAARAGDVMHAHRMGRFRGWWMTLNGLTVIVCALMLPVKLVVAAFFVLWLTKVVALNVANEVYGRPPQDAAGVR